MVSSNTPESEAFVKALLQKIDPQLLLRLTLKDLAQQGFSKEQILSMYEEARGERTIPISIFHSSKTPLASLCLYLQQHFHLSTREIATLLQRHPQTIWAILHRATDRTNVKKVKPEIKLEIKSKISIPLSALQDPSRSILENLVLYLHKTYSFSNSKIAAILGRSPNTIAVIYKRAQEKEKQKEQNTL